MLDAPYLLESLVAVLISCCAMWLTMIFVWDEVVIYTLKVLQSYNMIGSQKSHQNPTKEGIVQMNRTLIKNVSRIKFLTCMTIYKVLQWFLELQICEYEKNGSWFYNGNVNGYGIVTMTIYQLKENDYLPHSKQYTNGV